MGFRQTFGDFQPATRRLLVASLAVGLVLLLGFSLTDVGVNVTLGSWDPKPDWLKQFNAEWFHSHAYIPNIYAAITGFLIGAPVAVVVLATFTIQREEKAAADRVEAVSQIAWNQFRDAITDLCSRQRLEALRVCANRIQGIHDQTWHGFNTDIANQSAEEFQQTVAFAQQQSSAWSEGFQSFMRDVGTISDLTLKWVAAVRDWNTLDQYVRLQRLERGLPWFHRELDTLLQQRMIADKHPMRPFFDLHDGYGKGGDMYTAFDRVSTLGSMGYSQETFVGVWQYTDQFPVTRVGGYVYTAESIAEQMGKLSAFVMQIDRNGWPAHAPEDPPLNV
jgi:hypothetical protein